MLRCSGEVIIGADLSHACQLLRSPQWPGRQQASSSFAAKSLLPGYPQSAMFIFMVNEIIQLPPAQASNPKNAINNDHARRVLKQCVVLSLHDGNTHMHNVMFHLCFSICIAILQSTDSWAEDTNLTKHSAIFLQVSSYRCWCHVSFIVWYLGSGGC